MVLKGYKMEDEKSVFPSNQRTKNYMKSIVPDISRRLHILHSGLLKIWKKVQH